MWMLMPLSFWASGGDWGVENYDWNGFFKLRKSQQHSENHRSDSFTVKAKGIDMCKASSINGWRGRNHCDHQGNIHRGVRGKRLKSFSHWPWLGSVSATSLGLSEWRLLTKILKIASINPSTFPSTLPSMVSPYLIPPGGPKDGVLLMNNGPERPGFVALKGRVVVWIKEIIRWSKVVSWLKLLWLGG